MKPKIINNELLGSCSLLRKNYLPQLDCHYWAFVAQFTQSTSENKQSLFETCGRSPEEFCGSIQQLKKLS